VNKIPLWEKAYIKADDTKGDVVVVPLQYEKPLYFKTNFGNGSTLSIEKQSEFWIYKDNSGKYKAVVRIALPDKTYQDDISKSFAGYLLEEDWTGNSIATYLYDDGKVSLLKKNPLPLNNNNTANREGDICYVVNWYQCDYIGNGWDIIANCYTPITYRVRVVMMKTKAVAVVAVVAKLEINAPLNVLTISMH